MILEACLIVLTLYVLSIYLKPKENLPPGPMCLPFVGSLPYSTIEHCIKARKKYGNLFMSRIGAVPLLYICDYKTSKEALSKFEFADRPHWKLTQFFKEEKEEGRAGGIISSNGSQWHHNRRFLLRHLRDLGMGKSKLEGIILKEVEDLVEDFKELTKEPSKLPHSINFAVLNIVWQLVSSHRYDFKDEKVEDLMKKISDLQTEYMLVVLPDLFPILRNVFPQKFLDFVLGITKFNNATQDFQDIVKPFIEDHLNTLDPSNPRDLMDDYLIEMKEGKSDDYSHFSISDLTRITFDLFLAGSDITANMIRWFLIYMARFHEIQEKIQKEIDVVVPRDTLPGIQHRHELAYLDAAINEVQRHCSMVSMGVFRYTTNDVKLEGYDIPKGTAVFSLAALMHRDPAHWKKPDEFDPSRFVDENGKCIPSCEGFQAFGIGKRQCLGEQFARMELYLITAALLQNFTFSAPEGEGPMSLDHDKKVPNGHLPRRDQMFRIRYRN